MFEWLEYLELAHELSKKNDEKSQRSAVSRAYYAVFCTCRNWLYQQDPDYRISTNASVHREVAMGFLRSESLQKRRVGQLLHKLRRYRNRVDYEDVIHGITDIVQDSLHEAETIFRLLPLLRSSPATQQDDRPSH